MAASYIGGGAVAGHISGPANGIASVAVLGPVPATAMLVIAMFDHTASLRDQGGPAFFLTGGAGSEVITVNDSQGNHYIPVLVPAAISGGTTPLGLAMWATIIANPLTAADTITVGWSGDAASFTCYGAEFGGIAPNPFNPFSPPFPYIDGVGLRIGAALYSAAVTQDPLWRDVFSGSIGGFGDFLALAYGYVEDFDNGLGSYATTGSGFVAALDRPIVFLPPPYLGSRAASFNAITEGAFTSSGGAVTASAFAADGTIPGGYRLDITAAGSHGYDESHSPMLPYLDGSNSYNYPAAPRTALGGAYFADSSSGLPDFAFAQNWSDYIPPDAPIYTQMPALMDVMFTLRSTLTDAVSKIGGQSPVNLGHNEDLLIADLGSVLDSLAWSTPLTPLVGTIIDGSGTHVNVPLVYGDTSAGVTFELPRITIPPSAGGLLPIEAIATIETTAAVFNTINTDYMVTVSLYFPPESFPPPPPPVLPTGTNPFTGPSVVDSIGASSGIVERG